VRLKNFLGLHRFQIGSDYRQAPIDKKTRDFSARSGRSHGEARLRRQAGPPLIDLFSVMNSPKARSHVAALADMDSIFP
jgi:hypothetical protein